MLLGGICSRRVKISKIFIDGLRLILSGLRQVIVDRFLLDKAAGLC
jgi:hypothetical protein